MNKHTPRPLRTLAALFALSLATPQACGGISPDAMRLTRQDPSTETHVDPSAGPPPQCTLAYRASTGNPMGCVTFEVETLIRSHKVGG
jgi:hypothetical protein